MSFFEFWISFAVQQIFPHGFLGFVKKCLSLDCCNKVADWLAAFRLQNTHSSQFWRLLVQAESPGRATFWVAALHLQCLVKKLTGITLQATNLIYEGPTLLN